MLYVIHFQNNSKYLDLSYMTELDFWGCFGREKNLSCLQIKSLHLHCHYLLCKYTSVQDQRMARQN